MDLANSITAAKIAISITGAKTAIEDIRDVASTLDGVVLKDLVSSLTDAVDELEDYLLSDAEEAEDKIGELERTLDGNQN